MNSRVTADIYSTRIRFDGTINVDTTVGCGQDVGVTQMETCSICAVTSQVDAAIGRSQGISAVQLQTRTICAVTCQADAAVGRG
ncbi:hypothetical protein, partial [Escherichia coli]